MFKAFSASAIFIISFSLTVQAQTPPQQNNNTQISWDRVALACNSTAKKPPSELSKKIAQSAIDEYYAFGGHRIDSNGRMFSFGAVESEQEEDDQKIEEKKYRLRYLAWWNVLRYWRGIENSLTPLSAAEKFLKLQGYSNAILTPEDNEAPRLSKLSVKKALAAINTIPSDQLNDNEREIIKEAIVRAGLNDVPWSAAFVSSTMSRAGMARERFSYSESHQSYIYGAFKSSFLEASDQPTKYYYRACPLDEALPRLDDLVCYHRELALSKRGVSRSAIRDTIAREIDVPEKSRTIGRTHCDVVSHYDESAKKIYVIGGNVHQSVTVKKLSLGPSFTLTEEQPEKCAADGHWTMPLPRKGAPIAPHLSRTESNLIGRESCSLNKKQWFVLLQARGT